MDFLDLNAGKPSLDFSYSTDLYSVESLSRSSQIIRLGGGAVVVRVAPLFDKNSPPYSGLAPPNSNDKETLPWTAPVSAITC